MSGGRKRLKSCRRASAYDSRQTPQDRGQNRFVVGPVVIQVTLSILNWIDELRHSSARFRSSDRAVRKSDNDLEPSQLSI
jgi:hypothetical protein